MQTAGEPRILGSRQIWQAKISAAEAASVFGAWR
jgi:hypothetical protein